MNSDAAALLARNRDLERENTQMMEELVRLYAELDQRTAALTAITRLPDAGAAELRLAKAGLALRTLARQ